MLQRVYKENQQRTAKQYRAQRCYEHAVSHGTKAYHRITNNNNSQLKKKYRRQEWSCWSLIKDSEWTSYCFVIALRFRTKYSIILMIYIVLHQSLGKMLYRTDDNRFYLINILYTKRWQRTIYFKKSSERSRNFYESNLRGIYATIASFTGRGEHREIHYNQLHKSEKCF